MAMEVWNVTLGLWDCLRTLGLSIMVSKWILTDLAGCARCVNDRSWQPGAALEIERGAWPRGAHEDLWRAYESFFFDESHRYF
jgi:hypothetical protein